MPVRPVLLYPDPRLRQAAAPATAFDDALRQLAADLVETMRAAQGVGITAPHVSVPLCMVVLQLTPGDAPAVYVNPEIVWASDECIRHQEGSISTPGVAEEVERSAAVHLRFQDLDGAEHREEADGFRAACHQHEIDQLDGVFWIQRLSRLKRERVVKRYERLRRRTS